MLRSAFHPFKADRIRRSIPDNGHSNTVTGTATRRCMPLHLSDAGFSPRRPKECAVALPLETELAAEHVLVGFSAVIRTEHRFRIFNGHKIGFPSLLSA